MPRTTDVLVKGVLLDSYGRRYDGTLPDLTPFIAVAGSVVDDVVRLALSSKGISIDSTKAELIERLLAAHCYAMVDQPYSSNSTGGASASYQGQTGLNLDGTKFGQLAKMTDTSGVLNAIDKRAVCGMTWYGKTLSEMIDYADRN